MVSKRIYLLLEGKLYGVNKNLPYSRNCVVGVNKGLSLIRLHVVWGQ
jgi:hypothetical protein